MTPFLFIVGCPRSGTTMLRVMFDAHPDIALARESDFLPVLAAQFAVLPGQEFPVKEFVDTVLARPKIRRWKLDATEVHQHFAERKPVDYPEAVRTLYGYVAAKAGKARYGDKTPNYVKHIDLLAFMFPEARFIHLIRDGRDVARSFVNADFGPTTIRQGIRRWGLLVRAGRESGARLGPSRYTEVFYESLVADPQSELRRLAAFADLEYSDAMEHYYENAFTGRNHPDLDKPPTPGLRDWRVDLTPRQIQICHNTEGELLSELGYEVPAAATS